VSRAAARQVVEEAQIVLVLGVDATVVGRRRRHRRWNDGQNVCY